MRRGLPACYSQELNRLSYRSTQYGSPKHQHSLHAILPNLPSHRSGCVALYLGYEASKYQVSSTKPFEAGSYDQPILESCHKHYGSELLRKLLRLHHVPADIPCYSVFRRGVLTSSGFPSALFFLCVQIRLSHHLSVPSHLVVHAAFACALSPCRASKSIREGLKYAEPLTYWTLAPNSFMRVL